MVPPGLRERQAAPADGLAWSADGGRHPTSGDCPFILHRPSVRWVSESWSAGRRDPEHWRGIIARMSAPDPGSNTQPVQPDQPVQPVQPGPPPGDTQPTGLTSSGGTSLFRRLRWPALLLLAALLVGGFSGYFVGTRQRQVTQREAVAERAREQFDLGVEDLQARRFELARQRFEYVIHLDPTYPGAPERLAEALVALRAGTATPMALATPTPNLAPVEELFTQALAALEKHDWTTAIDTLIGLRAKDGAYRAVEVDGMFYNAFRNRGVQRIAEQGLLEEGIYDMSRAERFAPLDRDAGNWRSWAELYLQADSYMGLNWAKAAQYFAEVFAVAPYLRNDAYVKYATASQEYGEQLLAAGDPCGAEAQFEQSLAAWLNATLVPTATEAWVLCEQSQYVPPPTLAETPTPTATPTETPTG
jgi:tetratricopeptide (TPR) repeat protein